MIRIIKSEIPYIRRCSECKALFEYEDEDVQRGISEKNGWCSMFLYVSCPVCGKVINHKD